MKTPAYPIKLFIVISLFSFSFMPKAKSQSAAEFITISDRIYDNFQSSASATLDADVASLLSTLTASYYWPDISYGSQAQSDWTPGIHLSRMATLAKAYSRPSSTYYGDPALKTKITGVMNYWLGRTPAPSSSNWFYLSISVPKDIGNTLISLRKSPSGISSTLETNMINWMKKGTAINQSPANQGSNLTDVAQHYIMRACLTQDQALLNQAVTEVTNSIEITTGLGIQNDNSYTAHGQQLYIYGYGREYISGISNVGVYVAGTSYAFSADKLAIFSEFVRKGFIKPSRGAYTDYNLYGRSVSRAGIGIADADLVEKVKNFDLPAHTVEYDNAIQRMRELQPPSYNVSPEHIHYWRTDYTVHNRPAYTFALRSVSTRTVKSENGNGENIKGYYLTEGVNYIGVSGDEYYNIFPVWEWNKIPGTTVPEITTYPVRDEWGVNEGTASFVGGVSDGKYGASAYAMNDYNTTAKKSWFYFDEEVVCLGADISSIASQQINTTVNQCLLKTAVTVADASSTVSVLSSGVHNYTNNLKWALQGNVGYFFPANGNISLSNQTQTGSWNSINTGGSTATVSADVFKLWFKHGIKPANSSYSYIVTPGKTSVTEMENYNTGNISILSNTGTIQAVRHNELGIWQIVFYQAGEFNADGVTVRVDNPCIVMLQNVTGNEVTVHVADPSQTAAQIYVRVKTPQFSVMRTATFTMPQGGDAGSTVSAVISDTSPAEPQAITSSGDAFVRDGSYATTNYGTSTVLTVKKESTGYNREVFIKFDLSSFASNLDSAFILLRVNNANTFINATKWAFYLVENNSWTETGITWNNKPAHTIKLGEIDGTVAGNIIRLNITAAVISRLAADKMLTVQIVSEPTTANATIISQTDAGFNSREEDNASYRPKILLYGTVQQSEEPLFTTTSMGDAFVRNGIYATINYGTNATLTIKKESTGYDREVFIKFDLSSFPANLDSAKIQLRVNGANTSINSTKWGFYLVENNSWTETGITWNNKPAHTTKLGEVTGTSAWNIIQLNITPAVIARMAADKILSVHIVSEPTTSNATILSETDAGFDARESTVADYRPQILVYAPAPPGPTIDSITAIGDSYVRNEGNIDNNYGTQGYLVARNKTDDMQEVYLKFDMHGMRKNIVNAKVRLYAMENGLTTSWNISKADNIYSNSLNSWQETGVTWNNMPTSTGSVLSTATSQATAGYIYLDITSALSSISADSILSFKVSAASNYYSSFRSQNFAIDYLRPKIIYEYDQLIALPVKLIYFKGDTKNDIISLYWQTASEQDNDYFVIERSEDGITFKPIAKVPGHGTTSTVNNYSYEDHEAVTTGKTRFYYRLKQIDIDGTSTQSSIISLSLPNTGLAFSIGPNPTSGKLSVFANKTYTEPVLLSIYDLEGRLVNKKQMTNSGKTDFDLAQFPSGTYILEVKRNNVESKTFRFLVIK